MNIFVLDLEPYFAARDHCDEHIRKMPIEYGQVLSTVQHYWGNKDTRLYKPTHVNHPSVIWARSSISNYEWLAELFYYSCLEYRRRFMKSIATEDKLLRLLLHPPPMVDIGLTNFPLAMPDVFKVEGDPVLSYRLFYLFGKTIFATWSSGRTIPKWYREGLVQLKYEGRLENASALLSQQRTFDQWS